MNYRYSCYYHYICPNKCILVVRCNKTSRKQRQRGWSNNFFNDCRFMPVVSLCGRGQKTLKREIQSLLSWRPKRRKEPAVTQRYGSGSVTRWVMSDGKWQKKQEMRQFEVQGVLCKTYQTTFLTSVQTELSTLCDTWLHLEPILLSWRVQLTFDLEFQPFENKGKRFKTLQQTRTLQNPQMFFHAPNKWNPTTYYPVGVKQKDANTSLHLEPNLNLQFLKAAQRGVIRKQQQHSSSCLLKKKWGQKKTE